MRIRTAGVLGGLLVALAALGAPGEAPDLAHMDLVLRSVPDGPVAKVNEAHIDRPEYVRLYQNEMVKLMMLSRNTNVPDLVRLQMGVHCLTMLVQNELLYQESLKRKITISDAELEKTWKSEIEGMLAQAGDGKDKPATEAELLKRLGISKQQATAALRKSMAAQAMRARLAQDRNIQVSDADVKAFFDSNRPKFKRPGQLHLQQIFAGTKKAGAAPDEARKAEARKRVEDALKRIKAGESFEAVAKAVSESPDKANGGDLGLRPVPGLPPFFVEAAAKLQPGQISDVFESPTGFHIIKLLESTDASDLTLEQMTPRIRESLMAEKTDKIVTEFAKPYLDKPGYVEVYLQFDKTIEGIPALQKELKAMQKNAKPDANAPAQKAAAEPKKPTKADQAAPKQVEPARAAAASPKNNKSTRKQAE